MGLLTTEEAGRYLGKSPWWIRENIGTLGIPAMKVGRQWRFRLDDLDSWLEINRDASNRQSLLIMGGVFLLNDEVSNHFSKHSGNDFHAQFWQLSTYSQAKVKNRLSKRLSFLGNTQPCQKRGKSVRNWLTFKEVANELKIPLKSFYHYHYQGMGPKTSRYGRHLRVLETDLITWQQDRTVKEISRRS